MYHGALTVAYCVLNHLSRRRRRRLSRQCNDSTAFHFTSLANTHLSCSTHTHLE